MALGRKRYVVGMPECCRRKRMLSKIITPSSGSVKVMVLLLLQ